jgi:hypothetical protein
VIKLPAAEDLNLSAPILTTVKISTGDLIRLRRIQRRIMFEREEVKYFTLSDTIHEILDAIEKGMETP